MKTQGNQFAVRLLPSMTDFAFLMPIVFLFARLEGVKTLLGDCDTGWHIRTGEWIVANHWVPVRDIFSFTRPGDPWYAWEWLSDVLFAWLNDTGGLRLLVFVSLMVLSLTFVLLFRLTRRKANAIVAILFTGTAMVGSSIHWLARPHLFTLLFTVLFYAALENVRDGKTRIGRIPYLVLLPVVTVLWTNLHGAFFVGVVLIGCYGGGEVLKLALSPDPATRRTAWLDARRYFLSAAACLAASLLNPYTYHLHVHVVKYLNDPYQVQHIVEFFTMSFHHPTAIFFEVMLAAGVATALWNIARGRYTDAVLMVLWGHAALLAARNIPLFMIVAAPLAAAAVEEWLALLPQASVAGWLRTAARKFNDVAAEMTETDRIGRWHLVSVLGVLLVAALMFAPNPSKRFRAEFDPKSYPVAAAKVLKGYPAARIFTTDQWGDYLIWQLYPDHKVFVDGRSDFYGANFGLQYLDVLAVKYDWEKTLRKFGVDMILLPVSTPLAGALKETSRWRVVYDDGISLVFRLADPAAGTQISITSTGNGAGRDREVTKTQVRDRSITETKPKT
jgi:hypothetical protein